MDLVDWSETVCLRQQIKIKSSPLNKTQKFKDFLTFPRFFLIQRFFKGISNTNIFNIISFNFSIQAYSGHLGSVSQKAKF